MLRIRRRLKSEVPPDARELFEDIGRQRGNVQNMFRVYAHRPEIMMTMMAP